MKQQFYYKAINDSTQNTDSGIFIEFMLHEILVTLKKRQGKLLNNNDTVKGTAKDTVNLIKKYPKITLDELSQKLKKSRRTITRLVKKLQEDKIISRIGSDKTGYWEVKND